MADSSVRVSGPVEIEQTSHEAVAFNLMEKISSWEETTDEKRNREYWLTLYRQCYKATKGYELDKIFQKK